MQTGIAFVCINDLVVGLDEVQESFVPRPAEVALFSWTVVRKETVRLAQGQDRPGPADLADRDFHAANPNGPWVTDITGFSIPTGKVRLSPVIDCHDGMPVAWTRGDSPDADLANGMLGDACAMLAPGRTPVIPPGRGCRYRRPGWIRIRGEHGPARSMGARGCSPDDAAAEGFFGRVEQEFLHKRDFEGVAIDGFIAMLDECMVWYRDKRIKAEYGMSIMDRRIELGLVA